MTDFERSYAVFTYYCGDLGYSNDATIGFSTGDGVYGNNDTILNGFFACYPTYWANVVYEISTLGKHSQLCMILVKE